MTRDVQALLDLAIQEVTGVCEDPHYPQARAIRAELMKMRGPEDAEVAGIPKTLARIVVDSWPLGSDTTEAVVAAEAAYWNWRQTTAK